MRGAKLGGNSCSALTWSSQTQTISATTCRCWGSVNGCRGRGQALTVSYEASTALCPRGDSQGLPGILCVGTQRPPHRCVLTQEHRFFASIDCADFQLCTPKRRLLSLTMARRCFDGRETTWRNMCLRGCCSERGTFPCTSTTKASGCGGRGPSPYVLRTAGPSRHWRRQCSADPVSLYAQTTTLSRPTCTGR